MKYGRSLDELGQELVRQEQAKRDFLAPAGALRVRSNGHSELILNDPFSVNDVTHGQLANYIDVPKMHYDRMRSAVDTLRVDVWDESQHRSDNEPLFDVVVNRLLQQKGDDRRMVRTLDGNVRAFLSDSYNPDLDNLAVFMAAAKAMQQFGLGPENVLSCEVTDKKLYLKVVSPKIEAVIEPSNLTNEHGGHYLLKEPQIIQAGFVLSNSETGMGSLSVQQVVYKLMCTNLWTTEDAFRQRHIGKALEASDDGHVYRSDTRRAEAEVRLMKIRDHISDALDENRFKLLAGKLQETTEVKLEGSIEKIMEVTARKIGLSISEKELTLRHLVAGADLSLWGLTNAVTATAQMVESYDRASELEAAGARLFGLSKSEIREVVCAA